jgi:hypothetical protein
MPNLKCLVLRHRWRPAEESMEGGMRLACTRCGTVRHPRGRAGADVPVVKAGRPRGWGNPGGWG